MFLNAYFSFQNPQLIYQPFLQMKLNPKNQNAQSKHAPITKKKKLVETNTTKLITTGMKYCQETIISRTNL